MSDLFTPPRYHRDVPFHKHTDRAIGWLELFYDLVYVATLIQVGNFLSSNLTLIGFGQFCVLLFLVWWAWTGETLYQNRYFVDDGIHRLLVFVQMCGVAAMGLSVSGAFGDLSVQFALAYALVRLMLALMFVRVRSSHPESADISIAYVKAMSTGVAIWIVSTLVPDDVRWIVWLLAIVFEIVFFGRPSMVKVMLEWGPDDHHLVERFGIFTIIVLGEAFVKILDDAQGTALGAVQIAVGVAIVALLFNLWWLHFSDAADEIYGLETSWKPMAWSYGYLFLAAALVMFGVAAKKVFSASIDDPTTYLKQETRLLLAGAMVVFFVAQSAINGGLDHDATPHNHARRVLTYLVAAVVAAVVGLVATGLNPLTFTALLLIITFVLVGRSIAEEKAVSALPKDHP